MESLFWATNYFYIIAKCYFNNFLITKGSYIYIGHRLHTDNLLIGSEEMVFTLFGLNSLYVSDMTI